MVSKRYLKEMMQKLYWVDKKSTTDIASILRITQPRIHQIMKDNFIPRRSRKEALTLWWKQQKEKGLVE